MSDPEITDDESLEEAMKCSRLFDEKLNEPELISSDEDINDYCHGVIEISDDSLPSVHLEGRVSERDKIIDSIFPGTSKATNSSSTSKGIENSFSSNSSKFEAPTYSGERRMIGGVEVLFPVPPYGSQLALMSKVIEGMTKKVNCLLESPTGSGKTLALLCGALAWQRHERNRISKLQAEQLVNQHPQLNGKDYVEVVSAPSSANVSPVKLFSKPVFGEKSIYDPPNSADNGEIFTRSKRMSSPDFNGGSPEKGLVSIHKKRKLYEELPSNSLEHTSEKQKKDAQPPETQPSLRVPRIFYGARTHKQIQQVVKEFKRTAYLGEAKMTVLSSREYSCIREFDRKLYASKNDMCRICIRKTRTSQENQGRQGQSESGEQTNCKYYENRRALKHDSLPAAFDLEDLVIAGREKNACPYYGARAMMSGSQIIFCPYNYLIDPSIRDNLQISLLDEVIILDEGHNIEDICRDAATFTFSRDQLLDALKELEKHVEYAYVANDILHDTDTILKMLKKWNEWFGNQTALIENQPVNNNEAIYLFNIDFFISTLNNHNIGINDFVAFAYSTETFCRRLREDPKALVGISQSTGTLIEGLSKTLCFLFREEGKHVDDYKPALIRAVTMINESLPSATLWRSARFDKKIEKETLSLRLMCLNPAVVFDELKVARSVILSSGTLTPLVSLHSELGAKFPLQVSPNHVIPADRVWVGTLSTCPAGEPLECNSRNMAQVDIQDAIGSAILWTCQVTPHGVLCFLPSYHVMHTLRKRWHETQVWRKLKSVKNVFMESNNVKDHNDVMEEFYRQVGTSKGALLFAVYRGKVAEGMDFKDRQARAVITVGVPYPNLYDMMVKEKMNYNNRHVADKQLLPSDEWLRVQAYRALNQAVGRCVRHRNDWGAVLMLDARFSRPYFTEHLSKWVRNFLNSNHYTFENLVSSANSLERFIQTMTLKEEEQGL